ncbi:hypothetical protein JIM95_008315 [Corynebacterium sp. CCM 8835]|uniref:Adenylate kinase n=1 Tax=Corynebacterium antarcticum TaxID=2800405 RepID=A0A9Q4CDQ2_9CORY|nr:AAA family ATPase [Corynebacterium antarcticum]MCK7642900.1 hypothetical protein [Corynebacterium antarcticum]MCK7661403.1 hypothetical protein [Corynebacterium antarcticum]MCL0246140.1 hypothetical protein [Corynebacterium antarcticum]MCX7492389.1 hypothetical protein [Corynebacterium antarcticum]MCX7538498.1 hypothetical protein [Corynebacterium antarcticum]
MSFDAAVDLLADVCARGTRTILIGGRSGSGKTTLARAVAERTGHKVVHLDDFYPGWGGLAEGSRMVARDVLAPVDPGYTRWDWGNDRPGGWVPLDPGEVLIVEGVGTLTPENLRAARRRGTCVTVRVELDQETRRARALARDPEFGDWWEYWALSEERHAADAANVLSDVDLVVAGG